MPDLVEQLLQVPGTDLVEKHLGIPASGDLVSKHLGIPEDFRPEKPQRDEMPAGEQVPSFVGGVKAAAIGQAEGAANLAGSFIEFFNPVPGLVGIAEGIRTGDLNKANAAIQRVQGAMSPYLAYQPKTEAGKASQEKIANFLDFVIGKPAESAGELAQGAVEPVAGRAAGAIAGTIAQTATEFAGFGAMFGTLRGTKAKILNKEKLSPKETATFDAHVEEVAKTLEKLKPVGEKGAIEFGRDKPKFTGDAAKVEKMFDEATAAKKQQTKVTAKKITGMLRRSFVDVSGNLKAELRKKGDLGKQVEMRHDLIAGANAKSVRMSNLEGQKIYGGLRSFEHEYLDRMIQARRTLALEGRDIKNPKGLEAAKHQEWLNQLPTELSAKLTERANNYFRVMRGQLDALKKEGLITEESYQNLLKSGDYSPRKFLQHIDPDRSYSFGGGKISVPDSGLKRIEEGSFGLLEKDSHMMMQEVIARTQTRIFRNRANRALYALAKKVPDNGVVALSKVAKVAKTGRPVYAKTPAGHEKLSVMIEGQRKEMIMPNSLAKEWVRSDPAITHQFANTIGWLSGSKILKSMATGLNPEFALTNLPRDMAHIYLTTGEYSNHLPFALGQMGMDFRTVAKDAITKKGRWLDYINEGGGMEFLTHQGRFSGKTEGKLSKLQDVLGYVGETSEALTRLALRERAIRNGATTTEATWIARNYLDFSQGGNAAKAVDAAVPYLNAGIQGTRGIFRSAIREPKEFAIKTAWIGTTATSLYLANKFNNPEAWKQIPDYEKVNNFIVTTPFAYKDKDGNTRHLYFKIAKDQGQRVIATMFENLMAKSLGEEIDVDQVVESIQAAIPIIPSSSLPPILDAMLGYTANKDFWRNEDIWKGPDIMSAEEYTRYTHPAFVALGGSTGLSPERTQHALEQFFTSGNIYTALTGYTWHQVFDQMPEGDRQKVTEELMLEKPFIRKVIESTYPLAAQREDLKRQKIESDTARHMQNREFDTLSQRFYDGEAQRDEIHTFLSTLDPPDRKRLMARHARRGQLQDVSNRGWWIDLSRLNPEARATAYWTEWLASDEATRKELDKQMQRVPGIMSKRFNRRLNILKRKEQ